jgi:hypothetical protein
MSGSGGGGFELETLGATHAVCRLEPDEEVPAWAQIRDGALLSVTRGAGELSVVCEETLPPQNVDRTPGWRAIRVRGSLEHSLTGVLLSLAAPLAKAEIPIFAVSTYETDYVLVPGLQLKRALEALAEVGHVVEGGV